MKLKDAKSHAMGERNTEADLIQSVIGNRAKFVFAAHVATDSSSVGTLYKPKKRIRIYVRDAAAGNQHTWFQGVQGTIGAFGTIGGHVATLKCVPVTLTFIDGSTGATIEITGSTKATVKDGDIWNVRTKHFRCLGESIATQHIWKWDFKK